MNQSASLNLDTRGLIAAIFLGTVGALTIMTVPGFVMLASTLGTFDDQQLGYIASVDINSTAISLGIAAFLMSRCNWRHLAIFGLVAYAVGNVWTSSVHGYAPLLIARGVTGLGEGMAIASGFAALGCAVNPDRAFGIYLVVGLTISAALLVLFPIWQAGFGAPAVFIGLAVCGLAGLLLMPWLPSCNPAAHTWGDNRPKIDRKMATLGLVTVFLYFIAQGATWSYFERIGAANDIDPNIIGQALGLSSFAGMGGALLAVVLSSRMSRTIPLIVSGVISVISFWMLAGHVSGTELVVAGLLFNFGWNLAQPLLSGVCANADSCGRVVTAMGCIQTIGFGMGPALAAYMLHGHNFVPILTMSTAVLVASLFILLVGTHTGRGESTPVPAAQA